MYIQNDTYKMIRKYFNVFIFVTKLKRNIILLFCEFDRYVIRLMRPLLRQLMDR